jgi:hypothetical protein
LKEGTGHGWLLDTRRHRSELVQGGRRKRRLMRRGSWGDRPYGKDPDYGWSFSSCFGRNYGALKESFTSGDTENGWIDLRDGNLLYHRVDKIAKNPYHIPMLLSYDNFSVISIRLMQVTRDGARQGRPEEWTHPAKPYRLVL